jgi:hypothetical protein
MTTVNDNPVTRVDHITDYFCDLLAVPLDGLMHLITRLHPRAFDCDMRGYGCSNRRTYRFSFFPLDVWRTHGAGGYSALHANLGQWQLVIDFHPGTSEAKQLEADRQQGLADAAYAQAEP